ncbi:EamA family transporter [Paenibacillus macquariensis]|uniref:EamA-like transporter family protein n=1 Tax=Paenibacillus macquariensis TaxID=948756 RepID=A0ABY1K5I4_9BACL|nr:EamA-like transporter family protein [Paenibacillus macquariensis]
MDCCNDDNIRNYDYYDEGTLRHVDASKVSVLSNLEPFVAMIMGLILLYKPITGVEILGSLYILAGVMLSTYQRKMRYK